MPSITQDPSNIKLQKFIETDDFEGAISFLIQSDMPSNLKYFNLGYFYYRSGDLVKAKQHYELAKFHGMLSMELDKSIDKINEELYVSSVEDQYTVYENSLFNFNSLPDPQFYLLVSFLGAVCLFSLLKRWFIAATAVILLLGTVSFLSYETSRLQLEYSAQEKVFHSGPSAIFEEVGVIPIGVKLFYSKSKYDWQYVEYPQIFRGWVKRNNNGN